MQTATAERDAAIARAEKAEAIGKDYHERAVRLEGQRADAVERALKAEKERDASIGMQRPAKPPRYFNSRGEEVEHPVVLDARLDELRKVVALLLVKP